MNLILDIGNTQYKICVFNDHQLEFHAYYKQLTAKTIQTIIHDFPIKKAIYADTRGIKNSEITAIFPRNISPIALNKNTPLPIQINYETPETLGKDRIAGAVGAHQLFPQTPVLIIDIGTAITIDFVSETGIFEGGIIAPGPELRYRALHEFTGKLPLISPTEHVKEMGTSTITAIQSGVQNGILFEINQYILTFSKQYNNLKTVLTGGYAYLFDKKIKYPIFADAFLIPKGLNRILNYNE